MDQHPLPLAGDTAQRFYVVCSALNQAANRLRLASLLSGLSDDDAVLSYTSRSERITLARGQFSFEVRAELDELGTGSAGPGRRCNRPRKRGCRG
jgi:hypothetical protein